MKKYKVFILGCIGFMSILMSCHNSADEHSHDAGTSLVSDTLTLNHGAKWVVDTATNGNYVSLKTMTNMFAVDPFPALAGYQTYGSDMMNGINKMMKDCTMKGADHDELHKWLEPIVRQSNQLKNVTDTVLAKKIFDSVHTRVDLFANYFDTEK